MVPPPVQPPPRTPAPSRFLHSKRQQSAAQTHPSQSHTPPIIQPQASGGHQFQATPRFSAAAAASAPRPSSLALTPSVPPLKTRAPRTAQQPAQELVILDSSPVSAEHSPCASPVDRLALPEPIEFDSSFVTQSQDYDHDTDIRRASKRRRISITSSSDVDVDVDVDLDHEIVPSSSQLNNSHIDIADAESSVIVSDASQLEDDNDEADKIHNEHHGKPPASSNHPSSTPQPEEHKDEQHPNDSNNNNNNNNNNNDDDEENPPPPPKQEKQTQTHPTFSAPPRFKPPPQLEDAPRHPRFKSPAHPASDLHHPPAGPPNSHLLPDIFSPPRRRGSKYTSGGLAAELRDWLVEIKETAEASGGSDRRPSATASSVRLRIDQVRHGGPGMTLISGQPLGGGGMPSGVRAILAGEGSVEDGLGGGGAAGRGNHVAPGVVVAVAPPAWDVNLDGTWAVAYRWEVIKGNEMGGSGAG
ncbi:hypothetical protein B0T19DRAFT_187847 [Cercophora scortea]|uniref:Uncharacterized protein n=1 Tax=Cercophora scortea TaxID=314031 RepID=A0AAE0MDL4_9PEZI|nr:hypothetical protein B0T19DRAFT_187847 [Cercophora scortea]